MGKKYLLRIDKINPHCGCGDKGWYVLYEVKDGKEEVMGRDEFSYTTQTQFDQKVEQLKERYNAEAIIN